MSNIYDRDQGAEFVPSDDEGLQSRDGTVSCSDEDDGPPDEPESPPVDVAPTSPSR